MQLKTTNREPSKMGKKFEKNFSNNMYSQGAGELTEVDSMLNEKEQSFKKQIWDLAKMESLVHADPKLSAKYNEMAETGEETYGYHYNETIMNILFNDYVMNSQSYLQKYKNAVPAEKKRRDKSGINQLQQKGEEKMGKKSDVKEMETTGNFGVVDGVGYDHESDSMRRVERQYDTMEEQSYDKNYINAMKDEIKIKGKIESSKVDDMSPKEVKSENGLFKGEVEETTGAAASGSFAPALDFKTNEEFSKEDEDEVNETTTSASSGQFSGPFGTHRDKKLDAPAWKGGEVIGESYLTDASQFKKLYESFENEGMTSPNDDSRVPMAEALDPLSIGKVDTNFLSRILNDLMAVLSKTQVPEIQQDVELIQGELRKRGVLKQPQAESTQVDEHHLNTKEQKIDFIIKNTSKTGEPLSSQELMELPDETIETMYNDLEKSMGMVETQNVDEKAVSKNQQQFMGMVHAFKKGELDNPSPAVAKAADSMSDNDAEDFASTKHDGLPEKVTEYSELDKEVLSRTARKRVPLSELLDWANSNVLFSNNPKDAIESYVANKRVDLEQLKAVAEFYLENNLGYEGNVQTGEQDVLVDLISNIEEIIGVEEPTMDAEVEVDEAEGDTSSSEGLKVAISKLLAKIDPDLQSDLNHLMKFTDLTVKTFFNGDYQKAYHVIKAKAAELAEGMLSGDGQSMIGDNPTSMASTMKDVESPMGMSEGVVTEDGHCRKDERPVQGKLPSEDGSCEKKDKIDVDPKERRENKHNVDTRIKRETEKKNRLEKKKKEKTHNDDDLLNKNKKHTKKLKEMVEGVNEDKRPSVLVQMDRLHKENEKNFKSDMTGSNTDDLSVQDDEMDALGQYSEVGDNPYELGEKIEKEKLAKLAKLKKDSALKNVGDSTNDPDTEVPKRNMTAGELEQLNLDRGLGMQDIVYDNKPAKRFVDRMKKDMGEEIYDQAQKKMEYRAKAPMYNKDTQPVADGINKNQFEKNVEKYNDKKGITTEGVVTGKYRDEYNRVKFIDFRINEAVEVKEAKGVLLNLDGLGNTYTQAVTENVEMRDIMNSFNFYVDDNKVLKMAKKQSLTENKDVKSPVNEQLEKMKKLFKYDPSKRIDTSNVKKNRGF